jgi:hypothetical protein
VSSKMTCRTNVNISAGPGSSEEMLVSSGGVVAESSPMPSRERYIITRTASWFVRESKLMAKQGKTLQEIIQRLNDLKHVLRDWQNNTATHPMNLPSDEHPEFWDSEALEKFIAKRKLEWLKEPDSTDNI